MEAIKSALQALKDGISKSKNKPCPDVIAAVDKVSSVPHFLKLDGLSAPDFLKLSELLRQTIQPLLKYDLALTLHFSSAVFLGIHNTKVTRTEDPAARKSWEMAQSSVLSGLLDYLDEHKTAKAKGPIGQAFFTTLCRLYFSSAVNKPVEGDPGLLATVYMLLSDVVSGQAANAAAFRKELMGGQRLGYTIYNMKAFLPLEAALDLFGNVLFGFKGSSRDRANFIRDVFDPRVYSNSSDLVELLSKVTDSEGWNKASPRVCKLIASLDIAFPQPFEVNEFRLRGCNTKKLDNLYVDEGAFLASVPVPGGSVDTLGIQFSDIERICLSPLGQQFAVTLKLNKPPRLGNNLLKCGSQDIEAHWNLAKSEFDRFVKSLKHRMVAIKINNLEQNRKLSVAEAEITLQLDSNSPPKPTQDKVEVIRSLWGETESNRAGTDRVPTSPLFPQILPLNFEEERALVPAEDPPKTVFIDAEGNLTEEPTKIEPRPATVSEKTSNEELDAVLMTKALSVLTRTMSAGKRCESEETRASKPRKRGIVSKRKSRAVVSDDGSELTDVDEDVLDPPSPSPMHTFSLRPAPSGGYIETKGLPTKIGLRAKKASDPVVPSLVKLGTKQEPPRLQASNRVLGCKESALSVKREPSAPRSVTTNKRPAPQSMDDDDEPPAPPSKKSRPSPKPRPAPPTRYSKRKLRNSSPITVVVSDNDEPHKATSVTLKRPSLDSKKRVAMRDRNGQTNTKQPVSRPRRKTATKVNKGNTDIPNKKDVKPDIVSSKELEGEFSSKNNRLSVKKEAMTPHIKPKEVPKSTGIKRSSKPKQAPWQRDSFTTDIQNQSTPFKLPGVDNKTERMSLDWEAAPAGAFDFQSVKPIEPDTIDISDDLNASATFVTEPVEEYWIPTKGANESFDDPLIIKIEQQDVEMVDLTSPVKVDIVPEVTKPHTIAMRKAESKIDVDIVPRAITAMTKAEFEVNLEERRTTASRAGMPKHDINGKTSANEDAKIKIEPHTEKRKEVAQSRDVQHSEDKFPLRQQAKALEEPSRREAPEKATNIGGGVKTPAINIKKVAKLPDYPRSSEHPLEGSGTTEPQKEDNKGEYTLRLPRLQPKEWGNQGRLQPSARGLAKRNIAPGRLHLPGDTARNPFQPRNVMDRPQPDIVEVLHQINEAIVDKINGRCTDTSQGMSHALLAILRGAAEDLKPLYHESAEHFNALVDIEEEYASHRRRIMTSMDSFRKSASQAGLSIKQVIQNHSRHGLSKKFPPSLFTKPVPTVVLRF